MQAVNRARLIATGNGNLEENGLYVLLISRNEGIIGLVKSLLPKLEQSILRYRPVNHAIISGYMHLYLLHNIEILVILCHTM